MPLFCKSWPCIRALKAHLGASCFPPARLQLCQKELMAGYEAGCTLMQERAAFQNCCHSGDYFNSLDLKELLWLRGACFRVREKKKKGEHGKQANYSGNRHLFMQISACLLLWPELAFGSPVRSSLNKSRPQALKRAQRIRGAPVTMVSQESLL